VKFSLSWLKALLDTQASTVEIAEKLTALGLEIESVTDASAALQKFRVARVLTAEKHPQADKLQVLSVDLGDGSPLQVVCGAPNARAGLVGVLHFTATPYPVYFEGAKFVHFLIGPATVALAVPLYAQLERL
jgi:phenylalanyl-tRNA synthetase beta chain